MFDFEKDYILEDEVARLRPLLGTDFDALVHYAVNEPDLWKYFVVSAAGEDGIRNFINLSLKGREEKRDYPFIVWDKRKNKYAGCTRFYDIHLENKVMNLGSWYGKEFQGTGLNKHCKYLLLQFAFEIMGIERIEFRADNHNQRSIAAMKSIGCVVEGVLRSNAYNEEGKRRDTIVLSILKEEWEKNVKSKMKKRIGK